MNFDPKNRQHQLLLICIVVVGLFLGDKIIRAPLWNAWNNRADRIKSLQKQVAEGETLIHRADSMKAEWSNMRTNTLPTETAAAESLILGAFDRWSRSSQVSVSSIRPQWKSSSKAYSTLECRADVSGSLAEITRFLYEIERDPIGVKIDNATLATRDTDGAMIALSLQVSGLQLITQNQAKP